MAKNITYERLYHKLETKECEKKVSKLIRIRERITRGLGHVRCIKDENDKVLVQEVEVKDRWKSYFKNSNKGGM